MDARLAVRRKPEFRNEEATLLSSIGQDGEVAIYYLYDAFDATEEDLVALRESVVADSRVDELVELPAPAELGNYLAVEPLPGQYDQRADAAEQALRLLRPETRAQITSATLYVFDSPVNDAVRSFLINPVESGEKNLSVLRRPSMGEIEPLKEYPGFTELDDEGLAELLAADGMAMSLADLKTIQDYFRSEGRTPTEVELSALDTYWSDHCRHTTFNTELTSIENNEPRFAAQLDRALRRYDELRELNGRTHKPRTLMDMGTIMGRELRRTGVMDDQEVSEEINACSVYVDVEGDDRKWLLMFKNETHNHPTEIEPFGGASTCLGGAIRDPLSGRSWVYQAMRLSGAGDINTPREQTLEGKLPQRDISSRAAAGYSSYGNQIGLATTGVRELVHPGYVAKRMELGAVVAAAPADNVKRLEPAPGDVVIMLGGRTGRDGVGGATGSSKAHDEDSLGRSGAEVQKGNPVNERKIQRLFRREDVATKIVRCNDFGAGGVSVAVGELADSIDIHLERVPLKYAGLNAREIAISESQERMALVVRPEDADFIIAAAAEENIEAVALADITDTGRLRMFMGDEVVFDLSREFIDTNGADRAQNVEMVAAEGGVVKQAPASVLESLRAATAGSQEGMIEQFDSTVGRSTVLMPYGGATQKTDEQASIQTLPVDGGTSTASVMTWGYSPSLADESPYLMGSYSVVEALAKLAAAGGDPRGAWLSVQEYFQRLDQDPQRWGEVAQALLGLLEAQDGFQVAAIGGKDSMSGTYGEDLHVPATLVTFAVAAMDETDAISAAIPAGNFDLYLFAHKPLESGEPNYEQLNELFAAVRELRPAAASAVTNADLAATLVNMAVGNGVGLEVSLTEAPLGSIVVAVPAGQAVEGAGAGAGAGAVKIGATDESGTLRFGAESFTVSEALEAMESGYREVFPLNEYEGEPLPEFANQVNETETDLQSPGKKDVHVLLPVFPGTNSEYDMAEAFVAAGATYEFHVIRNLTPAMLAEDTKAFIEKLKDADILAFSGGFSLGDEPDGSAKFIAAFLRSDDVAAAVKEFVAGNGLVLGICNGFQALVKSGFLPYGDPAQLREDSPTLAHNRQLRHVSRIATTRVATVNSPWLRGFEPGQTHLMPVSHGEGRFVVSEDEARRLFEAGQVAFQYVDTGGDADGGAEGVPTMAAPANPNGSSYAIEGIVSADGRILGKMGHPERFREGLMRNIPGIGEQDIFGNAVRWVRGE
ncbi:MULTISPECIES: phosphoribosylformylglycinamidine synthase [Corynebacterium]|uniref:Phosphoribosylformylglycinamidine synthase n=1 Tax=Corynebacterium amycolatum TaxID=43765 RepID=A0AB38XWQ2_CORAY|nr:MULTISPECIES: phosphoribosylformylglycinamidine synthase [Corynebacterium]AIN83213.1 phosphoribosylformylglycinamidine synthase [Corynebacterium sp. ATCC 6931]MBC6726007.1 phosphoribosylformylglycinamidine synthase [Corynebacterium amycolatum]QRP17002.1 phosphoribosylformylglycinamidine synthase [Corynebacterium amycolatum]WET44353.1 phosphoribosylformylglycinamidine synthase [Corynebacterium amycolatum]